MIDECYSSVALKLEHNINRWVHYDRLKRISFRLSKLMDEAFANSHDKGFSGIRHYLVMTFSGVMLDVLLCPNVELSRLYEFK